MDILLNVLIREREREIIFMFQFHIP